MNLDFNRGQYFFSDFILFHKNPILWIFSPERRYFEKTGRVFIVYQKNITDSL